MGNREYERGGIPQKRIYPEKKYATYATPATTVFQNGVAGIASG